MFLFVIGSEDILNVKSLVGHDGIASITVTLQTTAFHNLSVAGRPTVGVRNVRHLSSRGDSDQNFGRVTVLVGAVSGLLSDSERWLLDRAHGSIDDDSGCWVASLESTRCKHHAFQYTRSLTLPTRKADRTIFPWQQCYSSCPYVFMLFCLFLQVYTGWPI